MAGTHLKYIVILCCFPNLQTLSIAIFFKYEFIGTFNLKKPQCGSIFCVFQSSQILIEVYFWHTRTHFLFSPQINLALVLLVNHIKTATLLLILFKSFIPCYLHNPQFFNIPIPVFLLIHQIIVFIYDWIQLQKVKYQTTSLLLINKIHLDSGVLLLVYHSVTLKTLGCKLFQVVVVIIIQLSQPLLLAQIKVPVACNKHVNVIKLDSTN